MAAAFFLSVWSYNPLDPSFSTATALAAQNWLGVFGSFAADVFLQLFGLTSLFLFVAQGVWAYGLANGSAIPLKRLAVFTLGLWSLGVFLSASPHFLGGKPLLNSQSSWAQGPSIGGVVSYILLFRLQNSLHKMGLLYLLKPLVAFNLVGGVVLCWYGVGLSFRQLKDFFKSIFDGFSWFVVFIGTWIGAAYRKKPAKKDEALHHKDASMEFFRSAALSTVGTFDEDRLTEEDPLHSLDDMGDVPVEMDELLCQIPEQHKTVKNKKQEFQIPDSVRFGGQYHLPPIDLLDVQKQRQSTTVSQDALAEAAKQLETVLEEFGVKGEIVNVRPGPVVTMFELKPSAGIKTSRVIGLADDIARSM